MSDRIVVVPGRKLGSCEILVNGSLSTCDWIELKGYIDGTLYSGERCVKIAMNVPKQEVSYLVEYCRKFSIEFMFSEALSDKRTYYPNKWIQFEKNALAMLDGRDESIRPVYAEISLTLACNFGCHQCTSGTWKHEASKVTSREATVMTLPRIEKVLQFCQSAGVMAVLFAAGGEPTLNPHLLEAVRLAKGFGFQVGLYSNGSFNYKEDLICELLDKLDLFRISLHAATPEEHANYHDNSSKSVFRRVLCNVETCASINSRKRVPCNFGLNNVINDRNRSGVRQLIEFIASTASKYPGGLQFSQFIPEVRMRSSEIWGFEQNALVAQRGADFMEPLRAFFDGPARARLEKEGVATIVKGWDLHKQQRKHQFCRGTSWYLTEIDPLGNVYFCTQHSGNPKYAIGNVMTQSFSEIWYGQQRLALLNERRDFRGCPATCKQQHMNEVYEELERAPKETKDSLKDWIENVGQVTPGNFFI